MKVIDAKGEIPWNELSRFDNVEMRALMNQIVNRLYTFFLHNDDPHFAETVRRWSAAANAWDAPENDAALLRMIDQQKKTQQQ